MAKNQGRFSQIPHAAVRDTELSSTEFKVLAVIGLYLNQDHEAWPMQSTIAEVAGKSQGTVQRAIKVLEEKGYVRSRKKWPDRPGTHKCYQVVFDLCGPSSSENDGSGIVKNDGSGNSSMDAYPDMRSGRISHKNTPDEQPKRTIPPDPPGGQAGQDSPDWNSAEPVSGTLALMVEDKKYPLPKPFLLGHELRDYAIIDLRLSATELRDQVTLFCEYWRDKAKTQKGHKSRRGWKAAIRSWLGKHASSLKAQYRAPVRDYRGDGKSETPESSQEVDTSNLSRTPEVWRFMVQRFMDQGDWEARGPEPGKPGCPVPSDILAEFGFSAPGDEQRGLFQE